MKKFKNILALSAFSLILTACGTGVDESTTAAASVSENPVEALRVAETNLLTQHAVHHDFGDEFSAEYFFSYTPSASLNQLVGAFLGMPIPSVELSVVTTFGYAWTTLLELVLDGNIIPFEMVLDDAFTFALPGISNYFFEVVDEELFGDLTYIFAQMSSMGVNSAEQALAAIDVYLNHIEEHATFTANYTLNTLGIEFETTKFEVVLTQDLVRDLFDALLDSPFFAEIREEVVSEINALNVANASMFIWLDDEGNIVRRTIVDEVTPFEFEFIDVLDGSYRTMRATVDMPNENVIITVLAELEVSGTSYTGPVTSTLLNTSDNSEISFYIEVENFRLADGFIYGSVIINEELPEFSADITIDFDREGSMQMITVTGTAGVFGLSADIGELVLGFGLSSRVATPSPRESEFAIRVQDNAISGFESEEDERRALSFLLDVEEFILNSSGILREALPFVEMLIEDLEFHLN